METQERNSVHNDVVYVYDNEVAAATMKIPSIKDRAFVTHALIRAYSLTDLMLCVKPVKATRDDLLSFHAEDYIDSFSRLAETEDNLKMKDNNENCRRTRFQDIEKEVDDNEYGLGYECPIFEDMEEWACLIAGSTLTGVQALLQGHKYAINWLGGWHHAQRDEASGFCYINDIVIGIQKALTKFDRVLYIDLDAHHGDGVENAFYYSNKVFTLSFHNFEPGYFPGTGDIDRIGSGKGKFFNLNVPLKSGVVDSQFKILFQRVFPLVCEAFKPSAIFVQCGADSISHDRLGYSNLTPESLAFCVTEILHQNKSCLFLGGGGYNIKNTAKTWALLTSVIVNKVLSSEIPEHEYFLRYGPDFDLNVSPSRLINRMDDAYIEELVTKIEGYFQHLLSKCPPLQSC